MDKRSKMKTKRKMKRVLTILLAAVIVMASLAGCKYRITDKSVEEEVEEAIAAYEAEKEAEEAKKIEEEVAAKLSEEESKAEGTEETVAEPDAILMNEEELDTITLEGTEADNEGNVETAVEPEEVDDGTLQIVFMGDSIFDSVRDETGIARNVGTALGAHIYNLSIGGTSCALRMDKNTDLDTWNEPCFIGMVYAMEGKVDRDFLKGYKAGEIMETLDPSKTDYFILDYGTNDFLSYIPINAQDVHGMYYNYFVTAYLMGLKELQENYPDAKIIVCTPYYEQFWSADRTRYIGDAHVTNNGFGTFMDYINASEGIAEDVGAECINMYNELGIDIYTIDSMTEDGIHPNETARLKYAELLVNKINELESGVSNTETGE
ncbi:MAG: SGNH/GDSL hydrolase family protein [Lachnospiraceae bacterium]|nr:SGNH/GDSL hydrolase family protein [Lachnospiraceae bacterium]